MKRKLLSVVLILMLTLTVAGSVIGSAAEVNMCEELLSRAQELMLYSVGTVLPGENFPVGEMITFAYWRMENMEQYIQLPESDENGNPNVYAVPAEVLENVLNSYFANYDVSALHSVTGWSYNPEICDWDDNFTYYDPASNAYILTDMGGAGGEGRFSMIGYEVEDNVYTAYLINEYIYWESDPPEGVEGEDYFYEGDMCWVRSGYTKVSFLQEDTLKYYSWETSDEPYVTGDLIVPGVAILPEGFSVEIVDGTVYAYESCAYEYIDEITGEPKTHYNWADTCRFDAIVNGQSYENISLEGLCGAVKEHYDMSVHGFLVDDQDTAAWTPGNEYDVTLGMNLNDGNSEEVFRQEVKLVLQESTVKVEILSDVTVDELMGAVMEEEAGTWRYYSWDRSGKMDVSVGGTVYEDISMSDLQMLLEESCGSITWGWGYSGTGDQKSPFDQSYDNQWSIGHIGDVDLSIQLNDTGEYLVWNQPVSVYLEETDITGVTAGAVEYYAYQGYAWPVFTLTHKDNSTSKMEGNFTLEGDWPMTAGEHTVYVLVLGEFQVPIQVTVLPNPTSGTLADTLTWALDTATNTLTVSGTGAKEIDPDVQMNFVDYMLEDMNAKKIVVEEGVEYLPDMLFAYAMTVEELSLPSTLKELPAGLLGHSGSTEGIEHLEWESKGMSTLVLPEGITSWTKLFHYYNWGITDIYLPAGLTELNPENLCYMQFFRENDGLGDVALPEYHLNIHFAGTEEQWNAMKYVVSDDEVTMNLSLSGMGLDEAAMKEILAGATITFNDSYKDETKEEIKEEIKVESGVASVPDSIVEVKENEDVVIDVTEHDEKAESVVLESVTVDKIVNAQTNVEVKLPDATVSFDKTAIGTLSDKAGMETVTIVAKNVEVKSLTEKQSEVLKDKEVLVCLNLEAYAGESKISDFGGGKVTVTVPFTVPAEKKGDDFCVAYIDDEGKMTVMPTTYKEGVLVFETTHFSEYVVLEKAYFDDNPPTGDNGIAMVLALMTVSAGAVILLGKKKSAF